MTPVGQRRMRSDTTSPWPLGVLRAGTRRLSDLLDVLSVFSGARVVACSTWGHPMAASGRP